jgi:hypothetical protein
MHVHIHMHTWDDHKSGNVAHKRAFISIKIYVSVCTIPLQVFHDIRTWRNTANWSNFVYPCVQLPLQVSRSNCCKVVKFCVSICTITIAGVSRHLTLKKRCKVVKIWSNSDVPKKARLVMFVVLDYRYIHTYIHKHILMSQDAKAGRWRLYY